jgi:predicted O-methyltransferase YrrM
MTIAEIAKRSSISTKEARLLINLAKLLKPASILELGTSTGASACAFRIAAPEAQITTIEGCRELAEYIRNLREDRQTEIIATTFDDFFASPPVADQKWDLVHIDGNHAFDATLRYYEIIKEKHSHHGTCLIFDDIYWSAGMTSAWKKIITDPSNTLTLDLFCMGIVFFDPKLSKQHFSIKF